MSRKAWGEWRQCRTPVRDYLHLNGTSLPSSSAAKRSAVPSTSLCRTSRHSTHNPSPRCPPRLPPQSRPCPPPSSCRCRRSRAGTPCQETGTHLQRASRYRRRLSIPVINQNTRLLLSIQELKDICNIAGKQAGVQSSKTMHAAHRIQHTQTCLHPSLEGTSPTCATLTPIPYPQFRILHELMCPTDTHR